MIINVVNVTSAPRTRVSTADAVAATGLALATLMVGLYCAPRGFQGGFVDMAHDGYQLRQAIDLSQGGVIFRDTFDQYGPLSGYLNTIGFVTLGHRLLAIKYFVVGWYAVTAAGLYFIARTWLTPLLAVFAVTLWLALAPFYQHGIMLSPHAYALFFQTFATLLVIRARENETKTFLLVGLLAGLSWAVKQSYGSLYLVSIVTYLWLRVVVDRTLWKSTLRVTTAVAAGFFTVILVAGLALWRLGAAHDWYLQTVAFPREFYLNQLINGGASDPGESLGFVRRFVALQLEWPSWVVIRVVVLATVTVQLFRRRFEPGLLVIGCVAGFLWLGAYPSSNFMHQWWTASLVIPAFVVCIESLVSRLDFLGRAAGLWATVLVVGLVVSSGVTDRIRAVIQSSRRLDQTIVSPSLYRGIRSDVQSKRAIEFLSEKIDEYRTNHPGTMIVSIETSDGWRNGVAESLLFLSAFGGNTHQQPVYWSLPVLSTVVYPKYGELLWQQIKQEKPLIVDHHYGRYRQVHLAGYRLLAAAQSDYGYWYLYGAATDRLPDTVRSVFLRGDGWVESGFDERNEKPMVIERQMASVEGAWRGSIGASKDSGGTFKLDGMDPLLLLDPSVPRAAKPTNIYTWPSDVEVVRLKERLTPMSIESAWQAGADILKELRPGTIHVDGKPDGRFSYLFQGTVQTVDAGQFFVARGVLINGGFQVGVLENGKWAGSVNVTRSGPFEAIVQIQKTGRYAVVFANCLDSSGWLSSIGARNTFHVTEAGWVRPGEAVASR